MSALSQCSGCLRHVKVSESSCPFCGASVTASAGASPMRSAVRLGRAALMALGAGGAAIACEPKAVYGGPPVEMKDAGAPTPTTKPVPTPSVEPTTTPMPTTAPTPSNHVMAPAYGGPPPKKP